MNKVLITLALLLTYVPLSHAQVAYHDAKTIKDSFTVQAALSGKLLMNPTVANLAFFNTILKNYIPEDSVTAATSDSALHKAIFRAFKNNPFIEVGGTIQSSSLGDFAKSNNSTGLLASIGGFNVTTLADGLAKFLVERTKEELNIAFFERFRDILKAHPELGKIFPSTAAYLNAILNFEYSNSLSVLKEAFIKDLKSLPHNIPGIAELDPKCDCNCENKRLTKRCEDRITRLRAFFATEPGTFVIGALLVADGAIAKTNAADILVNVAANKSIAASKNEVANILKLANILSSSIRNVDPTKSWISASDLNSMVTNANWFKLYTGLVYQQIRNTEITINNKRVDSFVANNSGFADYLNRVVTKGEAVAAGIENIRNRQDSSSEQKVAAVAAFIGYFKEFFVSATNYEMINVVLRPSAKKMQFVAYTTRSLEITQNILIKNYSAAIVSTLVFIDSVLETRSKTKSKLQLNDVSKEEDENTLVKLEFKQSFIKYASFMANVVAAENSDDVKKAITAIALPPGSSSIKKTHYFNVALQAYTGLAAGHMDDGGSKFFNSAGVYAPLGISVSTGLKSWRNPYNKRTYGSLSLFASLIDVGAIVSYRFKEPGKQLSDSVKIRLENIFSPGANLVYGIPKWPVSVGGGFQWLPSLTRLSNEEATIAEKSGMRWHIFIAVDIPVLNLYTSRK